MKSISFVVIFIILSPFIYSQTNYSIQINGGVIKPIGSSNGLSGSVQFNYTISPIFTLYANTGYSTWDKFHFVYQVNDESDESIFGMFKSTYSEDNHFIIPFYIGSRITFNTVPLFSTFVDMELGYSYLSYNSYNVVMLVDPENKDEIKYIADPGSESVNHENLFGVGLGLGLSHQVTNTVNLILAYKLNSYVNSNYYGLFSTRGTYSTYYAGFNFKI